MTEKQLLKQYEDDFFSKTGKGLKFKVVSKWERLCKMSRVIDMDTLINMALECNRWDLSDIMSTKRNEEYVFKRHLIYYLLHYNGHTLSRISRYFKVHHTSIFNGVKKFEMRLETQEVAQSDLEKVTNFVESNLEKYEQRYNCL